MEGHLVMSRKERRRKSVFDGVLAGRLTIKAASRRLGLSYRQCRRSYARFLEEGDAGLVHRGRSRPSGRGYSKAFRTKAVRRYRERYARYDVGPTLAAEKLAQEGLAVDHETLRRWLLASGDWTLRRKRSVHRSQRERKRHFGELVQMDGSHHNWSGPDEDKACLMNMVDDATGVTMALLAEQETTEAAMRLLWRWIETYGVPQALYTDRKNVYITGREPTIAEELCGKEPKTAFGKACEKLGITIIAAHSPQAKGRVERSNGVYQDRLVKELALRRITTLDTANTLLANGFTQMLNAKFAKAPLCEEDYHCPVPKGIELAEVFSIEDERTVQNDWTVRHKNTHYQIVKHNTPLPKPKDKILVQTRLDGSVHLLYHAKPLSYRIIAKSELRQRSQPQQTPRARKTGTPTTPEPTGSPWRQGVTVMFADTKKKIP
jgi:transposase-like protein